MNALLDHCPCCGATLVDCDLMWRPDARVLINGSRAVALSRQETKVFDLVWLAKGNIVTAAAIIDALWAHDPSGGPDAAERCAAVYVSRINKKIRPLGVQLKGGQCQGGYRRRFLERAKTSPASAHTDSNASRAPAAQGGGARYPRNSQGQEQEP